MYDAIGESCSDEGCSVVFTSMKCMLYNTRLTPMDRRGNVTDQPVSPYQAFIIVWNANIW